MIILQQLMTFRNEERRTSMDEGKERANSVLQRITQTLELFDVHMWNDKLVWCLLSNPN